LHGEVEFTDEREAHVAVRHPDLLPAHRDRLAKTLADPDQVRRSQRAGNARLLSRWFDDVAGGRHVVAVVVTDSQPLRHWITTAYWTVSLAEGDIEWIRS